jgi:23S rRNA (adenine2503-C2)-methyltransferase
LTDDGPKLNSQLTLPDGRPPLLSLPPSDLAARLGGVGRARAVYALLRRGIDPFLEGLNPGARARLQAACLPVELGASARIESGDGTVKLLVALSRGGEVEMVAIPSRDRTTLCVSSQVGCARGCVFCRTATMGLGRNLGADEIAGQVMLGLGLAREAELPPVRNLVLMGMGEPLDNLDEVERALDVIGAEGGLGIGHRHITVSTVGPSPKAIRRAGQWRSRLAWSLHAADDALRRRLVPTARHAVASLTVAFQEVLVPRGEPLFVEIALIDGVNDDPSAAEAVRDLFRGFGTEVRINLLPLNPIGSALAPSTPERVAAFRAVLVEAGHRTIVRRARGADRFAACGQLATGLDRS